MRLSMAFPVAALLLLIMTVAGCAGISGNAPAACERLYVSGRSPVLLGLSGAAADAVPLPLLPLGMSTMPPPSGGDVRAAYQVSAPQILAYAKAWEELVDTRILPSLNCPEHGYCLPEMAVLAGLVSERLQPQDFVATARHLDLALTVVASQGDAAEKARLEKLLLQHEHAVLQFDVWTTLNQDAGDADAATLTRGLAAARRLQVFRKNFRAELSPWLQRQEGWESRRGDWAGAGWQCLFRDAVPLRRLPGLGLLRIDRDGVGVDRAWQQNSMATWRAAARTLPFRMDQPWDQQVPPEAVGKPLWVMLSCQLDDLPPEARRSRVLYLNFRGLPGRCVVYHNGTELIRKHEIPPASFRVPVTLPPPARPGAGPPADSLAVVVQLVDGVLRQETVWPVWLSAPHE